MRLEISLCQYVNGYTFVLLDGCLLCVFLNICVCSSMCMCANVVFMRVFIKYFNV